MRLFVAVAVPVHAADELDDAVGPLRQSWPALRWTGRDAWHLTLAFLGEVTEPVCTRLVPRLERAAARHPRLSLSLGGAGAFPGAARARVLWTGCRASRVLSPPWPRPWPRERAGRALPRPGRAGASSRT
jgi:2'-5' RNA ligase